MSLRLSVRDLMAGALARAMRGFAFDRRYFDLWQRFGYHVRPVHFYSPLPDTSRLPHSHWATPSLLPGIDMNELEQLRLLEDIQGRFRVEYAALPTAKAEGRPRFYLTNKSFESVDAEMLYGLIRRTRPRRIIEVGSGYSTLLAAEALARNRSEGPGDPGNNDAEMIAIDPEPRWFLKDALTFPVQMLAQPVQSVALDTFAALDEGDILFIDSSHVCKVASDVQFEILEILPRLRPGVLVHFHDIFWPFDYPERWIKERHRFWNEQYVVQAFMCHNTDFKIIWAGSWMHFKHPGKLSAAFPSYDTARLLPGSLWLVRQAPPGR